MKTRIEREIFFNPDTNGNILAYKFMELCVAIKEEFNLSPIKATDEFDFIEILANGDSFASFVASATFENISLSMEIEYKPKIIFNVNNLEREFVMKIDEFIENWSVKLKEDLK